MLLGYNPKNPLLAVVSVVNETVLTFLQAAQLIALGPTLFVIAFLLLTSKKRVHIITPVLYFTSLACTLFMPLLPLLHLQDAKQALPLRAGLMFMQSLSPALCFLLVTQFIQKKIPKAFFWFILALPILGGSPFIYGSLMLNEICLLGQHCFEPHKLMSLYNLFGSAFIFLLLVNYYERSHHKISTAEVSSYHTYCFIMAIIILSLIDMGKDLLYLINIIQEYDAVVMATIIRIGFVYLILISVFKVFGARMEIDVERIPTFAALVPHTKLTHKDAPHIEKITRAMQEHKFYREMGCTREAIAEKIGLHEVTLSRIINQHFHKNFNEFINSYRITEAKERLLSDHTAITVIAFEVGFNSIASFNRVFKEEVGISPSEFRKQSGITSHSHLT